MAARRDSPRLRALLLAVLALPIFLPTAALASAVPEVRLAGLLVPATAAGPGEALALRVALDGPADLGVQLKVWLEGEGVAQVQTWNGSAWGRADRYALAWVLDADGHAEGWLVVRAGESGTGAPVVHVRVRDARERTLTEAAWGLEPPRGALRAGLAPLGAATVGAWEGSRLLALAPAHPFAARAAPWDMRGLFRLTAPADATLRALDEAGRDAGPVQERPAAELRVAALLVDPLGPESAEFVRVANPGVAPAPLTGWSLAGPGWEAVFHEGELAPGAVGTFAPNAMAYAAATGRHDGLEGWALAGTFRLPNPGGQVSLAWLGGGPGDVVAWGDAPAPPGWEGPALSALAAGRLLQRLAALPDTDTAADFDVAQPWMAGWAGRAPATADADVAVFGRETSLGAVLHALAEAREDIRVEVYELTSPVLAGALAQALERGVHVRLLLEGAPVGGVPESEQRLLEALMARGAEVRSIGGSGRDRFGTMHAKFAVLDGTSLVLGSENWTPTGFARDGRGNFGWGAWVRSPELAQFFAAVWDEDADPTREDTTSWPTRRPSEPAIDLPAPAELLGPGPTFAPARVTALVVPDNARPAILALLARANATLDLEALDLPLAWAGKPSPVIEALRGAAARGVHVRLLLDGTPGTTNAATARALEAEAAERDWALEARLSTVAHVHNKAMVVDQREALVGSINSGEAAMTLNREAALLLEGAPVPMLAAQFEEEWHLQDPPPEPARADMAMLAGPLFLLAAAAVWRSRRRGGHGR